MSKQSKRGVRAPVPEKSAAFFGEFWNRRLVNLAADLVVVPAVRLLRGSEGARQTLNGLAGEQLCFHEDRLVPQLGRVGTYGFVILPGGCAWALEEHEGCTFCPFQRAVDRYVGNLPLDAAEFLRLFGASFQTIRDRVTMLNVFTAGSFFNAGEIPEETQRGIAKAVAAQDNIRILRVESRLEYIEETAVAPVIAALGGKTLDVVIGFETQDDQLRRMLRKGMSKRGLEEKITLLKRLGARVSIYLMIKPHHVVTEGWGIEEAEASIRFAFAAGADEIQLQATYIVNADPDGTKGDKNLMYEWHRDRGFEPPSLWSIAEILRDTAPLGPVMLGAWETEIPPPMRSPSDRNCPVCRAELLARIGRWRTTLDPAAFAPETLPSCACRTAWERETADRSRPPDSRMA
ncbi:hypothetical protein EPO33_05005 [Patescibacteria group bacterium]|nr:MAG: hypothetical protein EPO33_05005 [Patescibacteria group bacterium]